MRLFLASLLILVVAHGASTAQPKAPPQKPPAPPVAIDAAARKAAVDGLADALRKRYVFPALGERYAAALQKKLATGGYTQATASAFADAINADLQAVNKDGHLRVRFAPDFRGSATPDDEPTAEQKAEMRRYTEWTNAGVDKVQRLPGNIGLIDLQGFLPKEHAATALSSAMALVSTTNALIFDLRQNGGGDPETVAYLCSYLVAEGKRLHVNDIYDRPKNKTQEFWSEASLPAPRYVNRPVYVLTSARTFSGAEEFAYDVQTHKLGTIIGETTGGGAHPGEVLAVGGGFIAFVPQGRAINPITKTNWEGTGVKPDIAVTADKALQTAHLAALRAVLKTERDRERREMLESAAAMVERGETPVPNYSRH